MNNLLLKLAIAAAIGSPISAQVSPTMPKAQRVRITQGPEIELSKSFLTIIRWTTTNPGGSPVHYGIVHYGTDPNNLSETGKSPIRLDPSHASIIFRVRMEGLKPATTYYYTVESEESNGVSDGIKSPMRRFTTGS